MENYIQYLQRTATHNSEEAGEKVVELHRTTGNRVILHPSAITLI